MPTRNLGDLITSALGLGCMGHMEFYGRPDPASAIRTVQVALDNGVTMFDTADVYGQGAGERVLGQALAGRRDNALVATKVGLRRDSAGAWSGIDGSPAHIRNACHDSLRNLRVDHLDLYYLHRVDPIVPIEETVGMMAELVNEGKIRYIGLCEAAPDTVRRAHAIAPISAVQAEYSVWHRAPEADLLPALRELGVGFVAYSPLGRGLLTGSIRSSTDISEDDYRSGTPRFSKTNMVQNLVTVARISEIAAEVGCSSAQVALAWLLNRGPDIVAIPGTKCPEHLLHNLQAAGVNLSASDDKRLADAVPGGTAAGDPYVPERMGELNG
ncbi:aldo/keto reductase [Nocardia camponoti]|uniref:Aldo/keto reductase n=1 Tax=Nocardia camponoti TaxID=1616106 RepID=A0A917QR92_9NOCA|nr:aldo/keto reductase [Nocardia camponoti]